MSLNSFVQKLPDTHFIKVDSLRSDAAQVTLQQLINRFPDNDINSNKLLAILLTGLNLSDFTDEELLSVLQIDWSFLELTNSILHSPKYTPFQSRFHTRSYVTDYLLSEPTRRKSVNLKAYIVHSR